VLGATIILAILLSASSIYLSQQLPEWTEEYEANHAAAAPHDFATLTGNIERAVLSEKSTTTTSTPVGMLPEGVPLVGMIPVGGTLYFDQSEETFECIAAAPDGSVAPEGSPWNTTADWITFTDTYHVVIYPSKAELGPARRGNWTINKSTSLSGEYYLNTFSVVNNSTVTVEGRLTIHALKILIEPGSSINATGKGWSGGLGNSPGDNGKGVGGGIGGNESKLGNNTGGDGGGGGGLGGTGGDGGDNPNSGGNAAELQVYLGSSCAGEMMGCGGGGGGNWKNSSGQMVASTGGDGGSGGGYVCFDAAAINISGNISASGANSEVKTGSGGKKYFGGGGGGGSGGWIKIIGDNVTITGAIVASGGDGGDSEYGDGGGGGGGGIIEVFYQSAGGFFFDRDDVRAGIGGIGNGTPGENGTIGKYTSPGAGHHSYKSTLFHYESGYLISNMTDVPGQGQVGYDTKSSRMCYGNVTYGAFLDVGTDIVLRVRTSMYPDMHDAMPWVSCPPVANGTDISDLASVSDGHRYVQWRAELLTFDPNRTPELHWVNISYDACDPIIARTSGTISYRSQYLYYPNYKLVYAHGATIRVQDGREEFMHFPPPLFIDSTETGTTLKMTAIDVAGEQYAVSGRVSGTVRATSRGATLLKPGLNYENVTLKLTTAYPSVWERWFNQTCRDAGITKGPEPGQYNITTAGNALQVIFYGNETRPVNVWLKQAGAELKLIK